jgi:clusterin-associated protein 1
MKLNIKKLYSADGLAVKELLKLAQLLHKARAQASQPEEVSRPESSCMPVITVGAADI